jgi:hypothetical protein
MTFLPDAATMLAYTAACFVLFITPGPDMSLCLARTIAGGRWAGIAAMLGAIVGIEIEVHRMHGKWKVSQNRNASDRAGVAAGLDALAGEQTAAMAALVRANT